MEDVVQLLLFRLVADQRLPLFIQVLHKMFVCRFHVFFNARKDGFSIKHNRLSGRCQTVFLAHLECEVRRLSNWVTWLQSGLERLRCQALGWTLRISLWIGRCNLIVLCSSRGLWVVYWRLAVTIAFTRLRIVGVKRRVGSFFLLVGCSLAPDGSFIVRRLVE